MYTIYFPVPRSRTHACLYLSWSIKPLTGPIAIFWVRCRYCGSETLMYSRYQSTLLMFLRARPRAIWADWTFLYGFVP